MANVSRNIQPYKCSLRFYPPTLIVFYDDISSKKRRRRSIPLREFDSSTNISHYATTYLYNSKSHKEFVEKIKRQQIESLLGRIQTAILKDDPKGSSTPKKSSKPVSLHRNTVASNKPVTTTPSHDLNRTIDTSLTNLSGLPSLKPISSGDGIAVSNGSKPSSASAMSFDIDEILKQSDADLLEEDDDDLEAVVNHQDLKLDGSTVNNRKATNSTKDKQDDFLSLLLSTPTSSSPSTNGNKRSNTLTEQHKPVSDSSTLPALSSLRSAAATSSPLYTKDAMKSNDMDNNSYEDDFEQDIPNPKHNNDDYSLGNENLSDLSEEIESDSEEDEFNIGQQKLILQTSDLLQNEDNIITPPADSDSSQDEDYNKLSEIDYNKRKAAMEVDFKRKQVKPGDPGFIYDKDVKFDPPKMESGWDSNNSSDSEF